MISRRNFMKALVIGMACSPIKKVFASKSKESKRTESLHDHFLGRRYEKDLKWGKREFLDDKILNMYNIHTSESLNIKYYSSGIYDHNALNKINYFLRCHYTNEIKEIDTKVLDLLCDIKDIVDKDKKVHIISGYRSAAYNDLLVRQGRNVSKNSLHLQGLAIDFSIEEVNTYELSRIARSFAAGGVGKYPEFVHIDVGRVRYW
jgi:uncharacterized protein YcbK (DUF882 family)